MSAFARVATMLSIQTPDGHEVCEVETMRAARSACAYLIESGECEAPLHVCDDGGFVAIYSADRNTGRLLFSTHSR